MTRSDLEARGWVECGTCEGDGYEMYWPDDPGSEGVKCPDCVLGLVPSEKAVEAAALSFVGERAWTDTVQRHYQKQWKAQAQGSLIAAARAEMD
jgi:hypothetical protein